MITEGIGLAAAYVAPANAGSIYQAASRCKDGLRRNDEQERDSINALRLVLPGHAAMPASPEGK